MSAENERRFWPGGLTTEEVIARVTKGYNDEKKRLEALEAKRKAREQARTETVVELFPRKYSEQEIARRQAILDRQYQAIKDERAFLRQQRIERCGGSFNKSPDDPDFD